MILAKDLEIQSSPQARLCDICFGKPWISEAVGRGPWLENTVRTKTEVWFCHVSAVVDQFPTGECPKKFGKEAGRLEVQDGINHTVAANIV